MKRTIVVGLVLVMGLVGGCRRSVTVTGEDGAKATVTKSGKNVEIKVEGKGGGAMQIASGGGSLALPEGFRKDVPIYPGAKVATSLMTPEGVHMTLQTSDPADRVSTFYEDKLKANGWEIKATFDTAQGTTVIGAKEGLGLAALKFAQRRDDDHHVGGGQGKVIGPLAGRPPATRKLGRFVRIVRPLAP